MPSAVGSAAVVQQLVAAAAAGEVDTASGSFSSAVHEAL